MERDALLHSIISLERKKEALLREIDSVNLELDVQKAQYSRLVNNAALVYRMPNELLTGIFITCLQSMRPSNRVGVTPFQVSMSHVSHRWREVVLSTPLLWNTIDFRVRPMNHVQRRILSQLHAHLTRSDTCFLDVTLDFHIVDEISPYLNLLAMHSTRWRRLSIVTRYERVDDIRDLLCDANTPILEHLSLSLGKPQDGSLSPRKQYPGVLPSIIPHTGRSLRFVRLAGLALGHLHPPSSSVTTLHLDGWTRNYMTHEQLRKILDATTSLVNLSLNQLYIHHPRDPLEILQPVNLPNLLCLRIRGSCSPISRLLSLMDTPNLRSLSLQNVDTFDSDVLPSVQSLSLDGCAFDDTELGHLFRSFPSVTFLSIDESLPDIYVMLVSDTTTPKPWPHLETISVRDLQSIDVPHFCHMIFMLQESNEALTKISLDRRSRTVLRTKHRLDWLQERLKVENCDIPGPWPLGLGYEDTHDLLE
ncbi:hypothetical protein GALMADRAFT_1287252 [Galerina marginata CBS 339.88]|uniref:Uncharacterized protein n=1 Tax=Galerina marginata (strain CBS 339.88) TaxID=685588 RepID=A0A067T7D3_GALM3|nr:hypothetical protein GALMADRAFT_1287252 [Galerina marginata CBS 339.88]